MSGCPEQWTALSFCLMTWWWRSVEVWVAARTTRSSVKGFSITSWLSTTDTHNGHLCSATTFLISTQASPNYSVREESIGSVASVQSPDVRVTVCIPASFLKPFVFYPQWTGSGSKPWKPCSCAWSCRTRAAERSCVASWDSCQSQPIQRRSNCTKRSALVCVSRESARLCCFFANPK